MENIVLYLGELEYHSSEVIIYPDVFLDLEPKKIWVHLELAYLVRDPIVQIHLSPISSGKIREEFNIKIPLSKSTISWLN